MGWSAHIRDRHGWTDHEISLADRDGNPLAEAHVWHHDEYEADHSHDAYGQLHERRVESSSCPTLP